MKTNQTSISIFRAIVILALVCFFALICKNRKQDLNVNNQTEIIRNY